MVQIRAGKQLNLLEILNNFLKSKNELRDIMGENNNIARYYVSIHNVLAKKYNASFRQGFHDRYFILTGEDRWMDGPQEMMPYNISYKYYEEYTPEVLTDIMRDVLNYRLQMKEEMNLYTEYDIGDSFKYYPEYLQSLLDDVPEIGYADGQEAADEAYGGSSDVYPPTIVYSGNRFTLTSSQDEALIYYSLEENGVTTLYTGPVILSEPTEVFYWAKIGVSTSVKSSEQCEITSDGVNAFTYPPVITQNNGYLYISSSSDNATLMYVIDDGDWQIYNGPFLVSTNMQSITAMSVKNNEYSKHQTEEIIHDDTIDDSLRPANVNCSISNEGIVTLTCPTAGAAIYYSIDESDGYFRLYNGPFYGGESRFLIYTYSMKDGIRSKQKLVYKFDTEQVVDVPADVEFIDNGNQITLYTITPNATISYRIGSVGSFIETQSSTVNLILNGLTYIYAYSTLNGVNSTNTTTHTFYPQGTTNRPAKPSMYQDGNTIILISSYEIRYTINLEDPRVSGIIYNPDNGIRITEYTTVKAVAVRDGVFSDMVTGSFAYDDSSQGGTSGSQGGSGTSPQVDPTNGTDTSEPFTSGNWFAVTGATGLTFTGSGIYFCTEGQQNWKTTSTQSITGLEPSLKTYFKGNVNQITSFTGNATISGDISSLKGGTLNGIDKNYSNMFYGCSGLYSASGLTINISDMPDEMLSGMFCNCNNLHDAAFTINSFKVSTRGMYQMFKGCSNLQMGPNFEFTEIGNNGMYGTFDGCSKLNSVGSFNLQAVGGSALAYCFRNCSQLSNCSLTTPEGQAPQSVFMGMFYNCSGLTDISNIHLNYTSMSTSSYSYMFYGCSSIMSGINLIADTMMPSCYAYMYAGCTLLTTAPSISAITLASNCFDSMFRGCTSLSSSPDLNVTNLYGANGCYNNMFYGCSRLNHIKALFLQKPTGGYTANWVYGVAATGTFEVNKEATWLYDIPYGTSGIPSGWTIVGASEVGLIDRIWQNHGIFHIETKSNNDIYYLTSNSQDWPGDSNLIKYEAPFQVFHECYLHAKCKNDDGVFGYPFTQKITPLYPQLAISVSNRKVYIGTAADFQYDWIEYQICEYENTSNVIQDWTSYTTAFSIDNDYTIIARGFLNNEYVVETTTNVLCNVNSPVISFSYSFMDSDNPVIYGIISYPNTDILKELWYKINDATNDTPDTSEAWTTRTFNSDRSISVPHLENYLQNREDSMTLTAIAKVTYRGSDVWSPLKEENIWGNSIESLSVPQLVQLPNSNKVEVIYDGQQYPTWDNNAVVIEYKYMAGGAVNQYTSTFDLVDYVTGPQAQNVDMYVRARSGSMMIDWVKYTLYFNPAYVTYDVPGPQIFVEKNLSDEIIITINQNLNGLEPYFLDQVQTFYYIEVLGYDNTGFEPTGYGLNSWAGYSYPVTLREHVVAFRVKAYNKIQMNGDVSDVVWSPSEDAYWDIKRDFGINWDERPAPIITVANDAKITIDTRGYSVTPYMKIENTEWGPGALNRNYYNEYRTATYYGLGEESTGIYSGYVNDNGGDTKLAKGTIKAKYIIDGVESFEATAQYVNNNVTPLLAPTVTWDWDRNAQRYLLKVINRQNYDARIMFKINDAQWSGGVINTHKYDNWLNASYYGDYLDEYLISGTIIGRTVYVNEDYRDSEPYEFVNEHYEPLAKPRIEIIESNGGDAVLVTNNNKLATNYFRITNTQWQPAAGSGDRVHKYDNWTICHIYGNDLDEYLISGTIQVYSVWGTENTLDDLAEFEYDTGYVVNDTPPTITVSTDYANDINTITITNNADTVNFPRIKYKLVDIEWNTDEDVLHRTSQYSNTSGDQYKILSNYETGFTIERDVKTAYIYAKATDATNTTGTNFNDTAITSYWFENPLLVS